MKIAPILFSMLLVMLALVACTNSQHKNLPIEDRLPYSKAVSGPLFDVIRPNVQTFEIIAYKDNLIVGQKGTLVFVPKNSFIHADGETVKGKISIEMIEVLSIEDMIKANLQTISNGQVLQSEGMLYLDAKSDGKQLALANDKVLRIDLPAMGRDNTAESVQVFSGKYDAAGHINWTVSGTLENKLVPLPLDLFNYENELSHNYQRLPRNEGYTLYINNSLGNGMEREAIVDSSTLKQKKYANTFIASREFEKRFPIIESAGWAMGSYYSYCLTTDLRGRMVQDLSILNLYLDHTNKDLWYCDSLAYAHLKAWKVDTLACGSWNFEITRLDLMKQFKAFYQQRLTQVVKIPTDIDLSQPDAGMKFSDKGYEDHEVDEIMGAYHRQLNLIEQRRNKLKTEDFVSNSFAVSKLGWINCDKFYNEPNARASNISVVAEGVAQDVEVAWTLIIHGRRIAIKGLRDEGSKVVFTGKSAPYSKLPIGEKATLLGLSFKNEQPYMGVKEIVITENANYNIELMPSTIPDISQILKSIPL